MSYSVNTMTEKFLIPEIDFTIGYMGFTIFCDRLDNPKFLSFDLIKKYEKITNETYDIDFLVTKQGITIWCSRIKEERFLQFDYVFDLTDKYLFRVKLKDRLFVIPYQASTFHSSSSKEKTEISTVSTEFNIFGKINIEKNNIKNLKLQEYNVIDSCI